jgi:single-stranded-DNA-specific exonuclease
MVSYVWDQRPCDEESVRELASALKVNPIVARVLCLRGHRDPDAAARFLKPTLSHLHDPMLLADMLRAVERTLAAVARREKIAIHGDYDVDGITSTVILRRALELLGADVVHFIPERLRDGYGLQPETIDRLHAQGAGLVISVACGIISMEAARRARELGLDLIITDHHEPGAELPPALAVINPKRHDCRYPDKHLAGVGVALKFVQALCARCDRDRWMPAFVKVAAIGTLADIVPLVGENRVIAKLGLEMLSKGPHKVGLRALLDVAGLGGRMIESSHVAFAIAPRVNAAGRMSTPDIAARLLLASDDAMATEVKALAEQLDGENTRRQQEEASVVAAARRIVETDPDVGAQTVLVVAGDDWHRGVIGIVASKLVEAFHRPAVVLSLSDGVAHGSCRSIPGFDMLEALETCAPLFMRFGGHQQAAGLTMEAGRVKELRAALNRHADTRLGPDDLRPRLRIDAAVSFRGLNGDLAYQMTELAPFGAGNPRPLFVAAGVEIIDGPRPLKDRHLKMTLRQDGRTFRAVAWRAIERQAFLQEHRGQLDFAFSLDQSSYNGDTYLELTVADARTPVE